MQELCPKCGKPLAEITTTASGRKLQRCSDGSWDVTTKKNVGCDYVKWFEVEPEELSEVCPKCSSPLVMTVTRSGKKLKKCKTGGWDKETKQATGCDFVEWVNGSTEQLDEDCPTCGSKLVLYTTANGKKMKKCSTSGWDRENRAATGCTYVQWLTSYDKQKSQSSEMPF